MITGAGNALADQILEKARENEKIATMYAVQYAQSDEPKHKATFEKYSLIANTYNEIHQLICQGLHAVEAEMRQKSNAATGQ